MIRPISGIYTASMGGVERIDRKPHASVRADLDGPAMPRDMLAYDSARVASVSTLAGRSSSLQLAVRNLNDISTYLNELL